MGCRDWGGPLSRIFDHAARSALSHSRACCRQRALARVVERRFILALAATGQCRGAGGVVAVVGLHVIGQLRLSPKRLGPEPRRGPLEPLVVTDLGEVERLGGVAGLDLAGEDRRQPGRQGGLPLGRGQRAVDSLGEVGISSGPGRGPCAIRRPPRRVRPGSGGRGRGCNWASGKSAINRRAARHSAIASSNFPWTRKA